MFFLGSFSVRIKDVIQNSILVEFKLHNRSILWMQFSTRLEKKPKVYKDLKIGSHFVWCRISQTLSQFTVNVVKPTLAIEHDCEKRRRTRKMRKKMQEITTECMWFDVRFECKCNLWMNSTWASELGSKCNAAGARKLKSIQIVNFICMSHDSSNGKSSCCLTTWIWEIQIDVWLSSELRSHRNS